MSSMYASLPSPSSSPSPSSGSDSSLSQPLLSRPVRPLAIGMRPYGDSSLVSSGGADYPASARKYAPLPGTEKPQTPFSYSQPDHKPTPSSDRQTQRASLQNPVMEGLPAPVVPVPVPVPVPAPAAARASIQAPGGVPSRPSPSRAGGWSCPACTFVNDPSKSHCAMCSHSAVSTAAPSLPPRRSAVGSVPVAAGTYARPPQQSQSRPVPQPQPQPQYRVQPQVVSGAAQSAPSAELRPGTSCSSSRGVYTSGAVPSSGQVVYVVQPRVVVVQEAYPCYTCGTPYALPYGATSWRCQCGQFNSLTGDGCNIM